MPVRFNIIAAVDAESGIGKGGLLPWHLKGDLKYFKEKTSQVDVPGKQNMVVMGRKTWESVPQEFRPLPGRRNSVLSHNAELDLPHGVMRFHSLNQVLKKAQEMNGLIEKIFIIGGATVYKEAILLPECKHLYITHILKKFQCDTYFPEIPSGFTKKGQSITIDEGGIEYYFADYERQS